MHRISFSAGFFALLLWSTTVFAYDQLAAQVSELEAKAEHLRTQAFSFTSSVGASIAHMKKDHKGTKDASYVLETMKLNREAALKILGDADVIYASAAGLLKKGAETRLGFFSQQQGETASLGDRVLATMQSVDCTKFSVKLIF